MLDKEELLKKQKQLDYCVYMMAPSYFKSAKLDSTTLDKILYMQYQDMKASKQIELEDKVIYILENYIIPKLNRSGINVEDTDIKIKLINKINYTDIKLYNDNFSCVISSKYLDDFCSKIKLDCNIE